MIWKLAETALGALNHRSVNSLVGTVGKAFGRTASSLYGTEIGTAVGVVAVPPGILVGGQLTMSDRIQKYRSVQRI